MLDDIIPPTLILALVLFAAIVFLVKKWLLNDSDKRGLRPDRRQNNSPVTFPFYDDAGQWITEERRRPGERRHNHSFIVRGDDSVPG